MDTNFVNMREIARHLVDATSHKVGRELKDAGYRGDDGRPTKKAFGEGFAMLRRDADHPEWVAVVWNKAKVCQLLEDFGWARVKSDE